jgi:NitT/TauT family transport system substrate-binding protein
MVHRNAHIPIAEGMLGRAHGSTNGPYKDLLNNRSYAVRLLLILFIACSISACNTENTSSPRLHPVTVQLRWLHQAQFAGFYAADQNGYYQNEGLSVSFLEGSHDLDLSAPLLEGEAQFGIMGVDGLLLARSEGKPLKTIAVIYRRSPVVFFSRAELNIKRPQDFVGKTIRVSRDVLPSFHAVTARVGISPEQYNLVILPSDLEAFAAGKAHVWSGFINGFALTAREAGYHLNYIYPDDYGVHFYADCIVLTDEMIDSHPDVVQRFLRASLKGWTYVVEAPREVAGPLVAQYKKDVDTAIENAKMIASLPLVNPGEDRIGWIRPDILDGMEKTLREQGILKNAVELKDVYTLRFLEDIYGSKKP